MAPKKNASSLPISRSPISIGNCEVSVEARNYACESEANSLQISVSKSVKVRISVREDGDGKSHEGDIRDSKSVEIGEGERELDGSHSGNLSFVLVNPKDLNSSSRSYLQEVLGMYTTELPDMKYAANTGKHSTFLERCVMNGKYCSLFLKYTSEGGSGEVIAAITYQIVPADTQYAEIPLAAVSSAYQRKGVGCILYTELRKRLQSVGVCSIICWGDKESEGFWHKQGFVSLAQVDVKGRTRRLPIKADIRKALCFPGGSTLMISHLKQDVSAHSADSLKLHIPLQPNGKTTSAVIELPSSGIPLENQSAVDTLDQCNFRKEMPCLEINLNDSFPEEEKKSDGPQCQDEAHGYRVSLPIATQEPNKLGCFAELSKIAADDNVKHCSCSTQGSGAKRVWEASLSSLKSKKVKGSHVVGCEFGSNCDVISETVRDGSCYYTCPSVAAENNSLARIPPKDPSTSGYTGRIAENCILGKISEAFISKQLPSNRQCFKIMLMNIADESKKANLTKVIGDLGGIVTSDGRTSTHVITGKVRATLNFCSALCSGAWIVSPCWLKESYRHGNFLDELSYVLNDEEYALKYRAELRTAVLRAKESPGALLKGYDVCLPGHPSTRSLSTIVRSAGGNIIGKLNEVKIPSKTIFVASEEDVEEAMLAAKKGIWTFSGDWLMNCVMRQELDLEAPKFAESL